LDFTFEQNVFRVIFWQMPDSNSSQNTPQFTTAEYSSTAGDDRCAACHQPVLGHYYRVNGKMACENCVQQVEARFPKDSHAAYVRGLFFGTGAAIVGMILYAAFTIVTGIYLGYVALAVGWLVGKGIILGSKGIGGRRYQIAAVILTYAAVSIAFVPIVISSQMKEKAHSSSTQVKQEPFSDNQTDQSDQAQAKPKPTLGTVLLKLLVIGLASPFLELQSPSGIIGLVILLIGIRIAWRITAGTRSIDIQGPYESSIPASV
jgi:hypothetical protein